MPPAAPLSSRSPAVAFALVLLLLAVTGREAEGQRVSRIPESLVREVMPEADRFDEVSGDPPVVRGYRTGADGVESFHGWVFLTSDLPPEQFGYSGPIEALVGLRPDGSLTGVRVTDYMESYMRSMGDFLRTPGFQEQFAGKHVGDAFRLWDDVEGISRVSISVRALSRGVRDAARRVAAAYGVASEFASTTEIADPVGLSWYELRQLGVVQRFEVTEPGEGSAGIALAYIENERLGEYFFGPQLYERALRSAERRGGAEDLFLYAIDGSRLRLFRQQGWSLVQGEDTIPVDPRSVVSLGLPSGGVVAGEATMVGLILLDGSVDPARPFSFVYDLDDLGIHSVEYLSQEARRAMAEATATASPIEGSDEAGAIEDVEAAGSGEGVESGEGESEAELAPGRRRGIGWRGRRR
jgi:Na+-translocating ferredoxin:NAD+ oxidoreductase RnfG subunit